MTILKLVGETYLNLKTEGVEVKEIIISRQLFKKLKREVIPEGVPATKIEIPYIMDDFVNIDSYLVSYKDEPNFIMEVK